MEVGDRKPGAFAEECTPIGAGALRERGLIVDDLQQAAAHGAAVDHIENVVTAGTAADTAIPGR